MTLTLRTKLFISKSISYIRNKIYVLTFKIKVAHSAKKKIINYKEFLAGMSDISKKNILVDFVSGYKIKCDGIDLSAIAETGVLEDYQKLKEFEIKKGDIVFDIGAHIGSFSMYAAHKGAIVYAFEPTKTSYDRLVENIKINGYENRVKAYNYGVYNKNGEISFDIDTQHSGCHSVYSATEGGTVISVKKLDDIVRDEKINKIDFLKIDEIGRAHV